MVAAARDEKGSSTGTSAPGSRSSVRPLRRLKGTLPGFGFSGSERRTDGQHHCLASQAMVLLGQGVSRLTAVQLAEEALSDKSCLASPLCVWCAMTTLACAGELIAADAHWVRLTSSGRTGLDEVLMLSRAQWSRIQGDLEGARRSLSALLREDVSPTVRSLALPWLVELLLELEDIPAATKLTEEYRLDRMIDESGRVAPMLRGSRAELSMAEGRYQAAIEDYLACGAALGAAHLGNPALARWRSKAALALAAVGEIARAKELAVEEWAAALRWGAPANVGWALYVQARIVNFAAPAALVAEAIDLLELGGARVELGRACFENGQWLAAAGQVTMARQRLELAARHAEWAGQRRRQQEIETALERLGAAGAEGKLSKQEAKIAQLAKNGYSNKEIAEKLVLTVRTVEFHLSSVYRKLGISGRRELRSSLVVLP